MAPEFVSFLQSLFFFIELVIYKRTCNALITDKKWDSKDSLLFFLSMQGSTVFINTTDNNVMKFSSKVFVKVSQNPCLVVTSQIIFI